MSRSSHLRWSSLAAVFLLAFAFGARANDTTARIATGGIELLNSADVRMLQETLTISEKLVRVRYRFLNDSDVDVRATIAFPMPAYGWTSGEAQIEENVGPITSFAASSDGAPVATHAVLRALAGRRDITRQLRAIGLTDTVIFKTFGDHDQEHLGFSAAQQRKLKQILEPGSAENGWKVEETLVWEQMFPAHREIVVEHTYKPLMGVIFDEPYQHGFGWDKYPHELNPSSMSGPERLPSEACVDERTRVSIQRRMQRLADQGAWDVSRTLYDVEYVLGTGRNWKGPIGDFTLRVETASPNDIVSLCFPGKPVRAAPNVLEFHQTNYVAQDRLVVYFYSIAGSQPPAAPAR
jgi:hypothetical protein